ncbi:MAG: M48 family metallopeptidase, partial [Verrucomicrobiales bacterium]
MDFFQSQDAARKKTKFLVVYFAMAVIGIILSIYSMLYPVLKYGEQKSRTTGAPSNYQPEAQQLRRTAFFQLDWFLMVAASVSGVILIGSGYKTLMLSSGGATVARDIGGRRVDPNSGDADERKLMNVIEEMAIASGVPVPEVYVMDQEPGINAFAAGKTFSDAAIGVSRGAMKLLNRDELQGVIAHEFSHILNGDMKLNLRLIGVLHGILILTIIGRIILRSAAYSGRSSRDDRGAGVFFMVLGVGLFIIGYIGVFFGHLIKSAVSRQREYLADASAVQFTRSPDGIGGALKKIGGLSYGSRLLNARAEEVSHMTFSNALPSGFVAALASHPPLPDRIKAIEPSWDGKFIKPGMADVSSSMSAMEPS